MLTKRLMARKNEVCFLVRGDLPTEIQRFFAQVHLLFKLSIAVAEWSESVANHWPDCRSASQVKCKLSENGFFC